MRITCPACTTSYTIADDKIGAKGRSVRCASCGEKWHVSLVAEPMDAADTWIGASGEGKWAPEPDTNSMTDLPETRAERDRPSQDRTEPDATVLAKAAPEIDIGVTSTTRNDGTDTSTPETQAEIDLEVQLAEINKRKDIESYAKKPKIKVSKKKPVKIRKPWKFDFDRFLVRARPAFGALVLVLSISVILLAAALRTPIVAAFPSLAALYELAGLPVNLRGLTIEHLQMLREVENAQPVLVVEGELNNATAVEHTVPAIRFALRGDDAQEIYAWSIEPKVSVLTPGATMRFRTRLASPPEQAADIQVRMIDRRNQQAALHD
jgi:predicted Zn finger-like uncharacterized protein